MSNSDISRRALLRLLALFAAGGTLSANGLGRAFLQKTKGGDTGRIVRKPGHRALSETGHGSVIILGAGVSGLVAAYELALAGYQVMIFEANERIGGRVFTVKTGDEIQLDDGERQTCEFVDDGRYFEAGAMRWSHEHKTILGYAADFQIPLIPFINYNSASFVYSATTPGEFADQRFPYGYILNSANGYIAQYLGQAIQEGFQIPDRVDPEDLNQYLINFGFLQKDGTYQGSSRAGYLVNPGAGEQAPVILPPPSPQALFELLATLEPGIPSETFFTFSDLGPSGPLDWQPTSLHPSEGMDQIIKAFVRRLRRLGVRIVTQRPAVAIQQNDREAQVTVVSRNGYHRTFGADFVLSTLMPHVLRKLDIEVSPKTRQALAAGLSVPASKVGLEMFTRWWETDDEIYGGQTFTDLPANVIVYPSQRFQEDGGVMIGLYQFGRPADSTAQELIDLAIANGSLIHSQYDTEIRSSIGMIWARMPHILGGTAIFEDGGAGGLSYTHLLEPDGRIFFAGDWLTYDPAWMNSSAESAIRTIGLIHDRDPSMSNRKNAWKSSELSD